MFFARLKMGRKALLWWESFCRIQNQRGQAQVTSWNEFKRELRINFYPLGDEGQLFFKWHHLKQGQGQKVEDFDEEYQDFIIQLDI